MILTRLAVKNYGVFREQAFDLLPKSNEKPIILFGGKNGAGKTSLFEAVKLCLYGPAFRGERMSDPKYEKFLRDKINRNPDAPFLTEAWISLEFKHIQFGKVDTYSVKRYWENTGAHVKESMEVFKNSQLLADIEMDQWQDFVNELIPQGVAKLFFFDGEQIQNLAEDEKNNLHLKESFDSLLGLDIIERLSIDLKYLSSRLRRQLTGDTNNNLTLLYDEQSQLKKELDAVNTEVSQIQNNIRSLKGQIQRQEELIAKEGGGYAAKRHELKINRDILEAQIKEAENLIREMCAGLLPFAISAEYSENVKQQLMAEDNYLQSLAAKKSLDKKLYEILERVSSDEFWTGLRLEENLRIKLLDRISRIIDEKIRSSEITKPIVIHNLSGPDQQKVLGWIDEALTQAPTRIKELSENLEKLTRERQEIEKMLLRSPPEEVLHPYIQQLNKLHTDLGAEEQKLLNSEEKRKAVRFKIDEVVRKLFKEHEKQKQEELQSNKQELIDKTKLLLQDYLTRIREQRLKELQGHLLSSLNHLLHKKLFERVVIDSKDFSVTLYDVYGNAIPKEQLSAGEKQIYAIAMLWALAKTSGRPLPFIIDTPLGRLDSDHRLNLVSNFFPYAGHQVIIFSTDTEIDQQYFEELEPFISRAYHLAFDKTRGATTVSDGYFWKPAKEMAV